MKFKFKSDLPHQTEAINAVVDLFNEQPLNQGDYEISINYKLGSFSGVQTHLGLANNLVVVDEVINDNLKSVQKRNNLFEQDTVKSKGKNFSIEMETGTGKTYVYLRTIFDLNKKYGFKKFIVVVPSVAIREGVLNSIDAMKEHFKELYNNIAFNHFVYDSKSKSKLREFAKNNVLQVMIINIDSFNKDKNVINTYQDKMGAIPIEFIQATKPIVILDEPQNMESKTSKEAVASLNPLCTLRYSATHRDKYNLIYRLDPVKAFQKKLVKKISVASVVEDHDATQAYIKLENVSNKNGRFTAKIKLFEMAKDAPKLTTKTLKPKDDLFLKSNEYKIYQNGFVIDEINARSGMEYIRFANGIRLSVGEEQGGNKDETVKKQIKETIKAHFDKEIQVKGQGIKVLSLFFLDRVENYRIYKEDNTELGKYGKWFEEIYNELAKEYKPLLTDIVDVQAVHDGYFSKDNKGHYKNTSGTTKDDESTYNLIMKRKEELLNLNNRLKFIFSHSALSEGWDNPNVFQICTLKDRSSIIRKRQEIGRGLRLPVNQDGERIQDEYINNLVVIANESYQDFVSGLQKEFEDDCGVIFGRLPIEAFIGLKVIKEDKEELLEYKDSEKIFDYLKKEKIIADDGFILNNFDTAIENHIFVVPEEYKPITKEIIKTIEGHRIENHVQKHDPIKGKVNEDVLLDPEFEKFWNAISMKTVYSVNYASEELVSKASKAIAQMDRIDPPKITTNFVDIEVETKGLSAKLVKSPEIINLGEFKQVPDVLSYIQSKVELTRSTIYEILSKSGRLKDFTVNPQKFMDASVKAIRDVLNRLIIEGIQYEKLDKISYAMSLFKKDEHKLEFAKDRIIETKKSVYNYITYDSTVEKQFAEDLETAKDIKYFIKLPAWFRVETPIGFYNPDWAILKQNGKIVYLIRETKSTKDQLKLRIPEIDKIACGRKHFEIINIDYDVATSFADAKL